MGNWNGKINQPYRLNNGPTLRKLLVRTAVIAFIVLISISVVGNARAWAVLS